MTGDRRALARKLVECCPLPAPVVCQLLGEALDEIDRLEVDLVFARPAPGPSEREVAEAEQTRRRYRR